MTHESKRWNPAHWTDHKVHLFVKHVMVHLFREASLMMGPHYAALALVEVRTKWYSDLSREKLKKAGVPLLGDN